MKMKKNYLLNLRKKIHKLCLRARINLGLFALFFVMINPGCFPVKG